MPSGVGGCPKAMSVGEEGNWERKICVIHRGRAIGEVIGDYESISVFRDWGDLLKQTIAMHAEVKSKALHALGKNSSTGHLCFLVMKAESGYLVYSDESVMPSEIIHVLAHTPSHVYSVSLYITRLHNTQIRYRCEVGNFLTVQGKDKYVFTLHTKTENS